MSAESEQPAKRQRTGNTNQTPADIDFSPQFEEVESALLDRCQSPGPIPADLARKLESTFASIAAQATSDATYNTKFSAIEHMCKMLGAACGLYGRQRGDVIGNLGDSVHDVMSAFSEAELQQLAEEDDGTWRDSFAGIVNFAGESCGSGVLVEALGILDDALE